MNTKTFAALLAAGSCFAFAFPASAQMSGKMSGMPSGMKKSMLNANDIAFMKMVQEGNLAEISTAKMAVKKAASPKVKQTARMIIMGHSQASSQLKALASKKGVSLPTAPNAKHRAFAAELQSLSGMAFDKAYVSPLLTDHVMTVAAFKTRLEKTNDPDLKKFVAENLPGIEGHTQMLATDKASMGKMSGSMNKMKM